MKDDKYKISETILFYDGDCGLCDQTVQFILKHEKSKAIKFSPLQSKYAKRLFEKNKIENDFSSLIVFHDNKFYKKSEGIVTLFSFLKPPYNFFIWTMKLFPFFIRNFIYDCISKNRKKIIKNPSCTIPAPADRARFII